MDMNFPHRQGVRAARPVALLGDQPPDLSILLAVASARQAASPTARCIAAQQDGPDAQGDFIGALAQVFAPRAVGRIRTASLAGCFNPLIAGHLMAEQES